MKEVRLFVDHEEITLTKEGVWLSNGEEITHRETARSFAKHLVWENNRWGIRIKNEFKEIVVEDTPYFVIRIDDLKITLNDGSCEKLQPQTLSYRPGRLVCKVKTGQEAKFLRPAYHEILKDLEEEDGKFSILLQGQRIPIGSP